MTDPFEVLRAELVRAAATAEPSRPPAERHRPWWRRRSHPLALVAAALVISGSAAAAVVSLTAGRSQPLAGKVPGKIEPASLAGYRYTITVTPSLAAGAAGWNSAISYSRGGTSGGGEGVGGTYASASDPVFGGDAGGFSFSVPSTSRRGDTVGFVLTGPQVAAVRIGSRSIATFASPQLPAGDRAAVFFLPPGSPVLETGWFPGQPIRSVFRIPGQIHVPGPHTIPTLAVLPVDAAGRLLATRSAAFNGPFPHFWQAPSAVTPNIEEPPYHGPTHPRPGACEVRERGLPALHAEWGHTLTRIAPARDALGEAFVSCVDTEYYLHGWPLAFGVLLDARRPGHALGAIPGAAPVAGSAGIVDFPAGHLSARRQGAAWLVVEGGSGAAQRVRVLRALTITRLARPSSARRERR